MLSIPKHADLHLRARDVGQLHRSTETLIFLWVIVLQTNLELNCLHELALLLLGVSNNLGNGFPQHITLKLTAAQNHKLNTNLI